MYTKEEVYTQTLEYFEGDVFRTQIWMDKYCLKDNQGNFLELDPDDMHWRLAKEFARIEQKYPNPLSHEEIFELLANFRFILPGGSILYGAGNLYSISSLANCFVIGSNYDSYGSIFQTDQEQVQLMKRRGGVGHDLSHLRPKGSIITNAAGTSTGIVPFMNRYSNSTREVAQDGRRGALMLTLDVTHPDIESFIMAKDDLTKITGANISVKVTDEFMNKVTPFSSNTETFIWNKLIHQAWKNAEPGILFWGKTLSEDIPSCYGEDWKPVSCNPCSEIQLCPYDSCRLLSVNLYSFVDNPFTDKAVFNYDKFKDVVYKAQRLIDDVVDLEEEKINLILNKIENDPEPKEVKTVERVLWEKIRNKLLAGRRTGLSAIGLADCLASLGITYGSNSSILLAEEIYKQFATVSYKSSIQLAVERGAFPIWAGYKERLNPFLQRIFEAIREIPAKEHEWMCYEDWQYPKYGRRNISCLTIPPSGTISLLAGISSGVEPVYQLYYKRRYKVVNDSSYDFIDATGDKWKEYIVWHPKFVDWYIKASQCDHCPQVAIEALQCKNEDSLQRLIKESPYRNSMSHDIDPIRRVKLQATIQKWIDHSISSTINLAKETTEEQVSEIYMTAWKEGCKGITIYREGSREGVLVSAKEEFKQCNALKRPKKLKADVREVKIKGQTYSVLVGKLYDKPYEVFVLNYSLPSIQGEIAKEGKGKYTYGTINLTENLTDEQAAITRLVSTALRHGADIKFIVEQLNKTHGDITSFSKSIARALKYYIKDEKTNEKCPECSSDMVYEAGCKTCKQCGYSRCG